MNKHERYNRSEKGKARQSRYAASEKGRKRQARYTASEKGRAVKRRTKRRALGWYEDDPQLKELEA